MTTVVFVCFDHTRLCWMVIFSFSFGSFFFFFLFYPTQVLSFTHPVSFHSAETFESLLGCLKMDDEKVAEAALQIFKNTGSKMEESFPHIKSYASLFAAPAIPNSICFQLC